MAISALVIYGAGQNGNTELRSVPEAKPDISGDFVPSWIIGKPDELAASHSVAGRPSTSAPLVEPSSVAALQRPPVQVQNPGMVTLNNVVEKFKAGWGSLAAGTRTKMQCHFIVAARHLDFDRDVKEITLADLRELKSKLSQGRKANSVNDIIFKGLGALFKIALDDEIIERSPLERLVRARRGEIERAQPTWPQVQLIESEVARNAAESAIIVGFMRNFGVGQAEIKHLMGEHIDLPQGVIHFRRKKTGKPFDVPIFPHARALIDKIKEAGRLKIGMPVIQWRNPRKALAAACERLELPVYEPRALRRTFIVHCLQQGIDPRVVAKWQGHKDAKLIFSVYGKFIDQNYEQAQAEKLGA